MRYSQKRFFVAGVCGLFISIMPCLALDLTPQIQGGSAELHTSKIALDVIYGKADAVELKMDIYFPPDPEGKTVPAVMFVHGGDPALKRASPVTYVSKGAPPFLL